jgi:hypothetical protein
MSQASTLQPTPPPSRMQRLAAVRSRLIAFAGRSGYETCVFGMLTYKILDALCEQKRHGQ